MPGPSQDLDLVVAALNVASRLLAIAQKQFPPGPPDFPQLQTIITLSGSIQATATQAASGGGGGGGGTTGAT